MSGVAKNTQTNVAESRMAVVIARIKEALVPLLMSDYVENSEIQDEVDKIIAKEDKKKITELQDQTTTVYIPLEEGPIVKRAKVSEEKAKQQADKVKEQKSKNRVNAQKQREE